MRILVISHFFSPDITAAAFRISETVGYLTKWGHDVRVITTLPHKGTASDSETGVDDPVVIARWKVPSVGAGGFANYIRHYLKFTFGSILTGLKLLFTAWRPDVIWVTSPPLFLSVSGLVLSKVLRRPLVLDIRDVWPATAVAAGQISSDGLFCRMGRVLEEKSYRWADHITCVSGRMAKYIREYTTKPVSVIYNGAERVLTGNSGSGMLKNTITYAGNFGRLQDLDMLIRAFHELKDNPDLSGWGITLIGTGAMQEEILSLVNELNLGDRVTVLPPMKKSAAMQLMSESRLLFINLKGDAVFELTIPSKVFDCLSVGRPILAGLDGEGKDILERTGANVCFRPEGIEALRESVAIAVRNIGELEKNGPRNLELVFQEFSRESNTQCLATVFESVRKERNV